MYARKGELTLPNLEVMEQTPTPIPRTTVGYSSMAEMYMTENAPVTPSFPTIARPTLTLLNSTGVQDRHWKG